MAKCDEGYLCKVCGEEAETLTDSDLYLRYVVGMLDPELLHTSDELHIRCNPVVAQYIVAEDFQPVVVEGPFDKRTLDKKYVQQQEALLTRGWQRLQQLLAEGVPPTILEYPLPEVIDAIKQRSLE